MGYGLLVVVVVFNFCVPGSSGKRMSSGFRLKEKTGETQKRKTLSASSTSPDSVLKPQPRPSDRLNPKTIDPVGTGVTSGICIGLEWWEGYSPHALHVRGIAIWTKQNRECFWKCWDGLINPVPVTPGCFIRTEEVWEGCFLMFWGGNSIFGKNCPVQYKLKCVITDKQNITETCSVLTFTI